MTPAHPDMLAIPDPTSVVQLPWKPEVAWVAANCVMENQRVEQAPRNVLQKQILYLLNQKRAMNTGFFF